MSMISVTLRLPFEMVERDKNITYFMRIKFVRIKCNRLLSIGGWHRANSIRCYY